jgi:phospholipid-binding lipoprotein MlaA
MRRPVSVDKVSRPATGASALGLLVLACLGLQACAPDSHALSEVAELNDPFEQANRQVYAFNTTVRTTLTPVVAGAAPLGPFWRGIHNVLVNLREPMVFANDLAQGRECAAGASLRRFMVNSTLGVGGILDVGKELGVEAHENDFGQTLAVWGMPSGPFLVIPALGPADARGVSGMAVEFAADPVDIGWRSLGLAEVSWPLTGMDIADRQIDSAGDLERLERSSLDGYAALRSAYRQNLEAAINDDKCPRVLSLSPLRNASTEP